MKVSKLQIEPSLFEAALADDRDAMRALFSTFLDSSETIDDTAYLGVNGFWGFGAHSWACLTSRRVIGLEVGPFRRVKVVDCYFENVESGGADQPSWVALLILPAFTAVTYWQNLEYTIVGWFPDVDFTEPLYLLTLSMTLGLSLPIVVQFAFRAFFRIFNCGFEFHSRSGKLRLFADKKHLKNGLRIYKRLAQLRSQFTQAMFD